MKQKRRIAAAPSRSLSSLADTMVIAIGVYLNADQPHAASLKEAIASCSEMLNRLASAAAPASDEDALSPQDAELAQRGLCALERAACGDVNFCRHDLTALQHLLVQRSMRDWKTRMNDFRQRRLKRGLRRHA